MNLVAVGFFFLGMAALLVLVFVAVRYLDEIEELLSKSVYVSGNKKTLCASRSYRKNNAHLYYINSIDDAGCICA